MTEIEELRAKVAELERKINHQTSEKPKESELKRGSVEPIYYPSTGRFLCVHKWKMFRTDYRTDEYRCLKCGAESVSNLGTPPNFTNYLLPFFLVIGLIGGAMFGTIPSIMLALGCLVGLSLWVMEIMKNDQIDDSNVNIEVVSRNR